MTTITGRVKCPRERSARSNACERLGCNHLTGKLSRVCGCCLVQLGPDTVNKFCLLRDMAPSKLDAFFDDALAKLNALPFRDPIGIGWGKGR